MSTGLHLNSSSLLSKYGFNDGDLPEELMDHLDALGMPYPDDWRPILVHLVRTHLLPYLQHDVEVEVLGTNHNPIRALTVDGLDVEDCHMGDQPEPDLHPESVTVAWPAVLAAIQHVEARPEPTEETP